MTYGLDNSFSFLYLFFLAVIVVIILIIIYDNKKKREKREKILRKIIMSDYNNPTSLSTEKNYCSQKMNIGFTKALKE